MLSPERPRVKWSRDWFLDGDVLRVLCKALQADLRAGHSGHLEEPIAAAVLYTISDRHTILSKWLISAGIRGAAEASAGKSRENASSILLAAALLSLFCLKAINLPQFAQDSASPGTDHRI